MKLSEIRSLVRILTGKPSTSQITDTVLDTKINEYYQEHFPLQAKVDLLQGWFTQATSPTDSGEYTVSTDVLELDNPVTVNGTKITFYRNKETFFDLHPKKADTAYLVTDPSLAIGSSNKAHVANSAFTYVIQGDSYPKAAAETALSGDDIPTGKYGAWRLEIDTDGTISIVEADDNVTGYDTAALAVAGLSNESSEKACMGFVTVVNSSAVFVPGTTELDTVTATYTDGFHSDRDTPTDVLLYGGILYAGPRPDDIYQIKAPKIIKPTALSGDDDELLDTRWSRAIGYGTAILILGDENRTEEVGKLTIIFKPLMTLINRKSVIQTSKIRRAEASF